MSTLTVTNNITGTERIIKQRSENTPEEMDTELLIECIKAEARKYFQNKTFSDFYAAVEGFYNDNDTLREMVETYLVQQGSRKMPMTSDIQFEEYENLFFFGKESVPKLQKLIWLLKQKVRELFGNPQWYSSVKKIKKYSNPPEMLRRKISPGISVRPMPLPLSLQRINDQAKVNLAANYTAPNGPPQAIKALRLLEDVLLETENAYPDQGIFITEGGGTNGICNVMNCIKNNCPEGELIVCGPSYFQFFRKAEKLKMPIQTIISETAKRQTEGNVRFLPAPQEIAEQITPKIKAVVITQPSNPTGEFYSREELISIIELAREKDFLLVDDAAFEEIVFPEYRNEFYSVAQVANEMGELSRVVTIKSFSKGKNYPAGRLGYIATKNQEIIDSLSSNLVMERDCPSNLDVGLICLDSVLRAIEARFCSNEKGDLKQAVEVMRDRFQSIFDNQTIDIPVNEATAKSYLAQRRDDLEAYLESFQVVKDSEIGEAVSDTKAAYNSIIKVNGLPQDVSLLDFAVTLFLYYGVETQWLPNFGLGDQESRDKYGVWLRTTFGASPEYISDSLKRIQACIDDLRNKKIELFRTGISL